MVASPAAPCGLKAPRLGQAGPGDLRAQYAAVLDGLTLQLRAVGATWDDVVFRRMYALDVPAFLKALASEGVAPTLIVMTDQIRSVDTKDLVDLVDGLYVRQNEGYDFGAWAHVARDVDLPEGWLNAGPAYLLDFGLP